MEKIDESNRVDLVKAWIMAHESKAAHDKAAEARLAMNALKGRYTLKAMWRKYRLFDESESWETKAKEIERRTESGIDKYRNAKGSIPFGRIFNDAIHRAEEVYHDDELVSSLGNYRDLDPENAYLASISTEPLNRRDEIARAIEAVALSFAQPYEAITETAVITGGVGSKFKASPDQGEAALNDVEKLLKILNLPFISQDRLVYDLKRKKNKKFELADYKLDIKVIFIEGGVRTEQEEQFEAPHQFKIEVVNKRELNKNGWATKETTI